METDDATRRSVLAVAALTATALLTTAAPDRAAARPRKRRQPPLAIAVARATAITPRNLGPGTAPTFELVFDVGAADLRTEPFETRTGNVTVFARGEELPNLIDELRTAVSVFLGVPFADRGRIALHVV